MGTETETAGGQGRRGRRDIPHDEAMAALYRDDPAFAVQVLDCIVEDGDLGLMRVVVRQMAMAFKDGRVVPK